MNKVCMTMLLAMTVGIFSGCGGGGGAGPSTNAAPPTKAVVKIATNGALAAGTLIGGVDVSIQLPSGVSAKNKDATTAETASGVVAASGVATSTSMLVGTYTNPVGLTSGGTVHIFMSYTNGYPVGEFVTITTDIAAGYAPVSADFSNVTAYFTDLNGVAINGITAGNSVTFE